MLTNEEIKVVADTAQNYPPGHGDQWLSLDPEPLEDMIDFYVDLGAASDACKLIKHDSCYIKFG